MTFTLTLSIPDDIFNDIIAAGKAKVDTDDVRQYVMLLIDKDLKGAKK